MIQTECTLSLPHWVTSYCEQARDIGHNQSERMKFVIELARKNVVESSGGPFGAAIFDAQSGELISVGVNRVEPLHQSVAHAEMMAIMLAQQMLGNYDLGADTSLVYELFTSGQMCAMCFGAIPWSGIRRVVCAATADDIQGILGFDEGPRHPHWQRELQRRGIEVIEGERQEEACSVLRLYKSLHRTVYNGRGGSNQC